MSSETLSNDRAVTPRWQPLEGIQRRVLGVLIEKAKTTPENYPLSLNSIRTGSNQKNNRAPLMVLEEDQVDEALEELRKIGAIAQIQGDGRVDKYRHLAYEWLGVEKVELAVMAELLLRGAQTVGELRGRAARMEPIKGLTELQPVLDALLAKRLIQYLTPPGRGSVVTHTLYLDREMDKVRREAAAMAQSDTVADIAPVSPPQPPARQAPSAAVSPPNTMSSPAVTPRTASGLNAEGDSSSLAAEVRQLREELNSVKREFQTARTEWEINAQQLRRALDDLNRQLGN